MQIFSHTKAEQPAEPPTKRSASAVGSDKNSAKLSLSQKLRHLVIHYILHLDDTPHRIALGVFLGLFIGATPTLGVQTFLYFGVASLLRANMVSGIVPVWFTNPFTAVPIYYLCWKLGGLVVAGRWETSPENQAAISKLIEGAEANSKGFYERVFELEFWQSAIELLRSIGLELWVGSTILGLVLGCIGYVVTYRSVVAYRARTKKVAE